MSEHSNPGPGRDDAYFLESVFFKVEGTIFQLPRYQFANNEVFGTTFTLPPGEDTSVEGSSETKPFELLGILKEDFRAFLAVLYPLNPLGHADPKYTLTQKEWVSVLALSDMWGFQIFKDFAISKLGVSNMEPVDKMLLAEKYNIPTWFVGGCIGLINRADGPQPDEIEKLGVKKAVQIYKLREMEFRGRGRFRAESEIRTMFGEVAGGHETSQISGFSRISFYE